MKRHASKRFLVYPDAGEVSNDARSSLSWAVSRGLIDVSSGKLQPKAPVTRVELALAIHRLSAG